MKTNEYQEKAVGFAAFGDNPTYAYAGLAEEAGEVLGKFAKFIRKHEGIDPHTASRWETMRNDLCKYREDIKKELGDVCWMVAVIAHLNGIELDDVLESNIEKLTDRKSRGVIVGEGDNR